MNSKKNVIIAVGTIVFAIAFYFLYWTKTPTYSIGLIEEAVKSHDVIKFKKHVNLDNVLEEAFDSLIVVQEEVTGQRISDNQFTMGMVMMMKSTVVDELEKEIFAAVEGKSRTKSNKNIGFFGGTASKMKNMQIDINDMSVKSNDNGIAYIDLKVYVPEVKKDMALTVKMSELSDGTWCLEELTNLSDFMLEIEKEKMLVLYKKTMAELVGEWTASEYDWSTGSDVKYPITITENNIELLDEPTATWDEESPFDPSKHDFTCKVRFLDHEKLGDSHYTCMVEKADGKHTMILVIRGDGGRCLRELEAVKK